MHAAIVAGLDNGTLNPIVGREFPLADAARAHQAVMEPGALRQDRADPLSVVDAWEASSGDRRPVDTFTVVSRRHRRAACSTGAPVDAPARRLPAASAVARQDHLRREVRGVPRACPGKAMVRPLRSLKPRAARLHRRQVQDAHDRDRRRCRPTLTSSRRSREGFPGTSMAGVGGHPLAETRSATSSSTSSRSRPASPTNSRSR